MHAAHVRPESTKRPLPGHAAAPNVSLSTSVSRLVPQWRSPLVTSWVVSFMYANL